MRNIDARSPLAASGCHRASRLAPLLYSKAGSQAALLPALSGRPAVAKCPLGCCLVGFGGNRFSFAGRRTPSGAKPGPVDLVENVPGGGMPVNHFLDLFGALYPDR